MTYKINVIPSPEDKRDWKAESILSTEVNLPEVWDMRNRCMEIRDQGTQGSCCAETAACIKEIQEFNQEGFDGWMSPQYIYNLRYNKEGEGMYPRDVMNILYKVGIVPEDDYPYGKIESLDQNAPYLGSKAANYKITNYASVDTVDGLKLALYKNGPCMFTITVYNSSKTLWKPETPNQTAVGGHSMTCVGYNKDGFIIRNSWGDKWGDNGYTIFPYSDWQWKGEVWTTIDENSSKPDPKYTKWYRKLWRYLSGYKKKFGAPVTYATLIINFLSIWYTIISKDKAGLVFVVATSIFILVRAIIDYIAYYKRTHIKD